MTDAMDELNETAAFLEVNIKEEVTDGLEREDSDIYDKEDCKDINNIKEEYKNSEYNVEKWYQEYNLESIRENSLQCKNEVATNCFNSVTLDNVKEELHYKSDKNEVSVISHEVQRIPENVFINSCDENVHISTITDFISSSVSTNEKHTKNENSEFSTPENSLENHFCRTNYDRIFSCQQCKCKFFSKDDVSVHLELIHGLTYICNECGKQFIRKGHLYGHMLLHLKIKKFKCEKCGKCFTYKSAFDRHNITYHEGDNYICTNCNKRFISKKRFDMHLLTPCSKDCENCVKKPRSKEKHRVRHEVQKKVWCEKCQKYLYSNHFKRHLLIHQGLKNFECIECGKCFSQNSNLERHLKIHAGVKDYVCVECGKSFFEKGNYTRHLLVHTGGNLFKCPECNKVYKDKYTFNIHCMRHKGIEKFTCRVCDISFAGGKTLKKHMLMKHSSSSDCKLLTSEQTAPSLHETA